MKYLGIDYGTKRIGVAVSDDLGKIAFPKEIILNDAQHYEYLLKIIRNNKIETIVLGESVHLDGSHNKLQRQIDTLKGKLEKEINLDIFYEKEWLSSVAAESHLYTKGNIANEKWSGNLNKKRRELADDKAAAVILQRFLDRIKK
jgi:putative Holliday junction resolvase